MKTFFKWLKDGNADRSVQQDVKSFERRHDGWMETSGKQILESKLISNEECQLLLNMQRYLAKYPEVDNDEFLEMLNYNHQELEEYRPLVQEAEEVSRTQIVDHLRENTWLMVAHDIENARFAEAEKTKFKGKEK